MSKRYASPARDGEPAARKRLAIPLLLGQPARSLFLERQQLRELWPAHYASRPNSKLEAAYHKGDKAIENIVKLLQAA